MNFLLPTWLVLSGLFIGIGFLVMILAPQKYKQRAFVYFILGVASLVIFGLGNFIYQSEQTQQLYTLTTYDADNNELSSYQHITHISRQGSTIQFRMNGETYIIPIGEGHVAISEEPKVLPE